MIEDLDNLDGFTLGQNLSKVFDQLKPDLINFSSDISDSEIDDLFQNDGIIKKIVTHYPLSAKSLGYLIKDNSGNIVSRNDSLILKAFTDASIMGRKYGKAFLVLSDLREDNLELTKNSTPESFKILFNLKLDDKKIFYLDNETKIHKSKVYAFFGNRTYLKNVSMENDKYADSVVQCLKKAFDLYFGSHEIAYYVISNLSYLIVGIADLKNQTLTQDGINKIRDRLDSINMNRSVTRIIAHDSNGESVQFISQASSGLVDVIGCLENFLVTNTGYPKEQLFESSPKQNIGSGISNQLIARMLWASKLKNWVEEEWLDNYNKLFNILFPNHMVEIPFKVEMNDAEKAEIEEKSASRLEKLVSNGIISVNEARTAYKDNEFTLNIALENSLSKLDNNNDSEPDDIFWDNLSNIYESDLIDVAQSVLS